MNQGNVRRLGRALCGGVLLCFAGSLLALEPPTPEQIKKYKADGTWAQRVAAAHALGNDRVDPVLALRAHNRLRIEASKAAGLPEPTDLSDISEMAPATGWNSSLPTTGTVKVLVILIDFPDYPHGANQTAADVQSKYFGAGNSARFPYDSLHNYYQRSSYNQLDIQGNVLGWYTAPHNRDYYRDLADTTGVGSTALIEEAMNYYNTQGHDFTQYDNNNDGQIDGFYIKWTGPIGDWATFWWAYYTGWGDGAFRIDGKSLGGHTWSWIAGSSTEAYDAQVDIHESGHMLGLPDYYDYDGNVGPDGGLGGLDIMDGNQGDHCCFSKYLLGWLTPIYVVNGTTTLNLRPTGTSQDCVLIMPSSLYTTGTWFDEYYMAQYRSTSAGNDSNFPTSGMTIWHIDATGYFTYNNSSSAHKLIRLMEADGEEDIENNRGGDAGDFYKSPKTFGSDTVPNSKTYDGLNTGIFVSQLGTPGTTMSANFAITNQPLLAGSYTVTAEDAHPSNQLIDPQERVTVSLTLVNVGTTSTTNLVATLLPTGGVSNPTGAQTYGATTPGGPSVTRNFSFTASGTCGSFLTMTLQCQDGAASFPSVVFPIRLGGASASMDQNFDAVTAPARPSGWTATVASGSVAAWATSTTASDTAPNSIFTAAPGSASDNRLDSPTFAITSASAQLTFRHRYTFQSRSDGGVLEISINGGAFSDILSASGNFVTGGYSNTLSSNSNPIGNGHAVWTGNSNTFITTTVNLPPTALGQSVKFRWRMGSNSSTSSQGWYVDSVSLTGGGEPVCSLLSLGDFDDDGDTDQEDFGLFQACFTGSAIPQTNPACLRALMDADMDVDQADLAMFLKCHTQQGIPAEPGCRNP